MKFTNHKLIFLHMHSLELPAGYSKNWHSYNMYMYMYIIYNMYIIYSMLYTLHVMYIHIYMFMYVMFMHDNVVGM